MAIKVRVNWSEEHFLLLGTGYGVLTPSQTNAGLMLGMPKEQEGRIEMVAVCDREGAIHWARSRDVDIVEIDGKAPSEWLA